MRMGKYENFIDLKAKQNNNKLLWHNDFIWKEIIYLVYKCYKICSVCTCTNPQLHFMYVY